MSRRLGRPASQAPNTTTFEKSTVPILSRKVSVSAWAYSPDLICRC
jgi:hypothetical protein